MELEKEINLTSNLHHLHKVNSYRLIKLNNILNLEANIEDY